MHEDTFYEYFKPFRHPDAHYDIWGGHGLETFGEDFAIVRRHDPTFVWTVVDGDSATDQWITTGVHYVNRDCYLITEKPHNWFLLEFKVQNDGHVPDIIGFEATGVETAAIHERVAGIGVINR